MSIGEGPGVTVQTVTMSIGEGLDVLEPTVNMNIGERTMCYRTYCEYEYMGRAKCPRTD